MSRHDGAQAPLISVVMANYRGERHIRAALDSVRAQTVGSLEIIVCDDHSPDASVEIVREIARSDPRIRLMVTERNSGPAAARNLALRSARGEWIAIVDSDDLLHPERFERLLTVASRLDAHCVADDLLFFADEGPFVAKTLLGDAARATSWQVTAAHFVRTNTFGTGLPALGYLKPFIRRSSLGTLAYDENLRIGEDYDFLLRHLLGGGRMFVLSDPFYLYRRHSMSISHRLTEDSLSALIESQDRVVERHGPFCPKLAEAFAARRRSLEAARRYERLVASIKGRRVGGALRLLLRDPRLTVPLWRSFREHVAARRGGSAKARSGPNRILLLGSRSHPPLPAGLALAAFGISADLECVTVPDYSPASVEMNMAQTRLWTEIAAIGSERGARLICHGAAGVYAAGFIPRKTIAGVALDDPSELACVLAMLGSGTPPLAVAGTIRDTLPEQAHVRHVAEGYDLVELPVPAFLNQSRRRS